MEDPRSRQNNVDEADCQLDDLSFVSENVWVTYRGQTSEGFERLNDSFTVG